MATTCQITITFSDKGGLPEVAVVGILPRRGTQAIQRALRHGIRRHYAHLTRAATEEHKEKLRQKKLAGEEIEQLDKEPETETINLTPEPQPDAAGPLNHLAGIVPEEKITEEEATLNLEDEDTLDETEGQGRTAEDVEGSGSTKGTSE